MALGTERARSKLRRRVVCALALGALGGCGQAPPPTNLLLVTIDTLRADRLGCYGYARAQTPHLDTLADKGILFEQAFAQAPVTLPSHSSLFTGSYPPTHGVHDNVTYRLSAESLTLAEVLQGEGYQTAAFVGAYPLHRQFGLDQGFSLYDDRVGSQRDAASGFFAERRAEVVVGAALKWLRQGKDSPFFCWVHVFDPHVPYDPPSPFKEQLRNRYDGEVAYVDSELGRLLRGLEEAGLSEQTLIVLTSDHGESLYEHGERTHGFFIYDATMHVPLILSHKSLRKGTRIAGQVRSVDIMPTVLDLLKVETPAEVQGQSLKPALDGEPIDLPAYLWSYVPLVSFHWSRLVGLRQNGWKYIEAPRPELYDLTRDPKEEENLFRSESDRADSLRRELLAREKSLLDVTKSGTDIRPDQETAEALRSLGYLGGGLPENADDGSLPDPKDRIHIWDSIEEELRHLTSGRYEEAIRILEKVIEEDPDNLLALEHLGYCQFHLDKFAAAERAFRRILELDPNRASAHVSLGSCLEKLGNPQGGREHFLKAQQLDRFHVKAYERIGYADLKEGDAAGAREQFEKALELDPGSVELRKGLARTYRQLGELDKASSLYRDLATESPDANILAELAEILLSQGHSEEAEKALRRSLELDAQQWKALYMRSMFLNRSGDESSAREVLEQVVELRPEFPQAHHDLGVIYARQGDEAGAVAAYRRALELAPNARSYNGLGNICARAGRWRAAVEHFKKAIEIQANYPTAYENLAQAYQAMGRPEQAEATLKRLEELRGGSSR